MVGGSEKGRWRAHIVRDQRNGLSGPKTDLTNERAEFLGERAGVVPQCTLRLVRVSVASHVRSEYSQTCIRQSGHYLVPNISRAEESVPEEDRSAVGIPTQPITKAHSTDDCGFVGEAGNEASDVRDGRLLSRHG